MPDGGPLRLVSYNIRFGGGRRLAFIGAVLAALEPDVVLLQEATDPSPSTGSRAPPASRTSTGGPAGAWRR